MVIIPDWPTAPQVKAASTTREGGVSLAPYQGLNLGMHVGDEPEKVERNRTLLQDALSLPSKPAWLNQTHSTKVLELTEPVATVPDADASFTRTKGIVSVAMTADCLPVLLCDKQGTQVAAVHAGWRGLVDGIVENALDRFDGDRGDILAWLGPAIGASAFEVGGEVREQFIAELPQAVDGFTPHGDKWLADLYLLATQRLERVGVTHIFGGDACTFSDSERFYSYRRDGVTGRQASLIWLAD